MIISIVNRSQNITNEELLTVIRAINRQIKEDFEPYWSMGATLRLEGAIGKRADSRKLEDMRGDAILYLADEADVAGALGYHDANFRGIPYGFVFSKLSEELGEAWSTTLSHEALELIGDPQGNLLVQGPHPDDPNREVFHWFEMCDAVQAQTYAIDGISVSNFLLPLYFTPGEQEGGRNDFLSARNDQGDTLLSFGVNPGGYIGFYDPESERHENYFGALDLEATALVETHDHPGWDGDGGLRLDRHQSGHPIRAQGFLPNLILPDRPLQAGFGAGIGRQSQSGPDGDGRCHPLPHPGPKTHGGAKRHGSFQLAAGRVG